MIYKDRADLLLHLKDVAHTAKKMREDFIYKVILALLDAEKMKDAKN